VESEPVGQAQLAFSTAGNEVLAGTSAVNGVAPSAAWIRRPNNPGQSPGNGLIAYTQGGRAWWSRSTNWSANSPTWVATSSASTNTQLRWPGPDNLCEVYANASECGGTGSTWAQVGRYNFAAKAVATGLDDVAAIVATGGYGGDHRDVLIVTSVNAGQSFRRSLLLSIPSASANDTGFSVDPESVHASVAQVGENNTPRAGAVAQPIYVTWRATDSLNTSSWWFTRVVVGASGTVAEVMRPRRLSFVPAVPGTHVSIFGYRIDGRERIGVAWSERGNGASTECDTDPSATTSLTWYASQTDTFGDAWDCFDGAFHLYPGPLPDFIGCDATQRRTQITSEAQWKRCVGPGVDGRRARNTDRPEVAMNMPAFALDGAQETEPAKGWYFAATKRSTTSGSGMRVCLYGTGYVTNGALELFKELYCSPDTDPQGGGAVTDAWAPALAVMQGSGTIPFVSSGDEHLIGIVHRAGFSNGTRTMATTARSQSNTYTERRLSIDGPGVPNAWESDAGLQLGLAAYQPCELGIAGCSTTTSFPYPNIPFLAAWPDTRAVSPNGNMIYARRFTW
jgi:hypothetical protein